MKTVRPIVPASPESHLPVRAPKKSGRKGIGPLDVAADFATPAKRAPEATGSLLVKQPVAKTVIGDRMEVFYLKPLFGKTKNGDITVSLCITVPLEDAHLSLL